KENQPMTNRDRVLNLIDGKPTDRLIWAPRMKIWYKANKNQGTLPEKYQGKSLIEIESMLGAVAAASARIPWKQRAPQPNDQIMQQRFNTVEVEKKTEGNREVLIYKTPIGSVTETYLLNFEAIEKDMPMQRHLDEHLIKEEKDYEIAEYIYQDITYTPTYDNYFAFEKELGDHGVPIVGLDRDPMFLIMQNLIGYNQFFFEFHDHKPRVERLYEVLCKKFEEFKPIVLDSPAKILLGAYHYDCRMISPLFFDEYMKPYLKPFAAELQKRGKHLGLHADADSEGLFKNIIESGFTFIDCFATDPIVDTTFEEAVDAWKDQVVIYGGVSSNLIIPSLCSEGDFDGYLERLFKTIKEKPCRVLVGIVDLVMPDADMNRVEKMGRMVERFEFSL
ncbi:uroporphyrinogen decarboxylase family protein, partial [Thermodesulfobacteriota bacterium]